ncbi:MAG: flippase [Lachnospiraceae bacterium]|nr:flippase [Lachnospiraceae bacterium]
MSLVFPVLTFVYASRILLVDGIGKINFTKSIVQYFSLFSSLGIATYGIREGAKVRDDKLKLSQFVHEILIINCISTLIAYILFFSALILIPKFKEYRVLLLIESFSIMFTTLGVDWFYGAIENYRYITIRSVVFQIVSLTLMFLFVKKESDYYIYAAIIVLSNVGSNLFNFIHLRKYIYVKLVGDYNIRRHIRPIIFFFAATIAGNIYLLLDTSMLGFLTTDNEVGLYTAANKMTKMAVSIISSISAVLLPRMSYYIGNNEYDNYTKTLNKTFHVIIMIELPVFVLMFLFSADILILFSGNAFLQANTTAKILAFVILFIPLSTVLSNQILLPLGKEKYQLVTTMTGAILNIISNTILIPVFADKGAALGTIIAEGGVLITSLILAGKTFNFSDKITTFKNYIIGMLVMFAIIILLNNIHMQSILKLFVVTSAGICSYVITLYFLKDNFFMEMIDYILKVLKRRKK